MLLGGCLAALLIAELVLKVSNIWIGRHSDTLFQLMTYDSTLGWKMKPNFSGKIDLVDVEDIAVQTNSAGFWDKEFKREKDPGRCRIAFLGDSFTWGMGVKKEERFTDRLQALHPEWEALNFGVPGYGLDQSLLLWEGAAERYQPDLVILTLYQNDFKDNVHQVRYGRGKPYFERDPKGELKLRNVPVPPLTFWENGIWNQIAPPYAELFEKPLQKRSRVIYWLAKNSDLARLVYTFLRSKGFSSEARSPEDSQSRQTEVQRVESLLLSALVNRLADGIRKAGSDFLVVLAGESVPPYEEVREELERLKIPYVDVRGKLPYYRYSRHWTPAAHRAVADLLAETIREKGFCPQK